MENNAYKRFLDGDKEALREIIRDHQSGLVMYLNSYVRDLNTADELCSEVFVRLAMKKPNYRGGSSFKTFLYAIGRNVALEYLRLNKRTQTVPLDELLEFPDEADPAETFLDNERSETIYRALGKLKPEYAQALWLAYFEELSNKEIAAVMKKSLSAVKSLLHRAKPALKEELEKEGFDYDEL